MNERVLVGFEDKRVSLAAVHGPFEIKSDLGCKRGHTSRTHTPQTVLPYTYEFHAYIVQRAYLCGEVEVRIQCVDKHKIPVCRRLI